MGATSRGRGGERLSLVIATCLLLASGHARAQTTTSAPTQARPKRFDIAAGPAVDTLQAFFRQSGLQVLANGADLKGVSTRALTGAFETDAALRILLQGTGLEAQPRPNGTVLIVKAAPPKPEQPIAAAEEPTIVTSVVVTGFRQSYADAIRMKRAAPGITDSISSDGLGRFPDLNVGEAIQRITGVQINREADSRNATINLRGLPGTFARTTINGQAFAEPMLDSSTPLGAFNSDIFSAITINKSPSASDQSGGLSGNIDLKIQPALSRRDGAAYKLSYEKDSLGELGAPAVTLSAAHHFRSNLAAFGVVAFKQERFRRDSINFNQYTPLNDLSPGFAALYADYFAPPAPDGTCARAEACSAMGTGRLARTGVLFPSDVRQVVKLNKGTLLTAAAGVEFAPSATLKLSLDGFFTRRDLAKNFTEMNEVDMRPVTTIVAPTSPVSRLSDGMAYVDALTFSNAQINTSYRSEPIVQKAWSLSGRALWSGGPWTATGSLVSSRGAYDYTQTQIDWRNVSKSDGNGTSGTFFSGGGDIRNYVLTLSPRSVPQVTPGPWTWLAAANPAFQQNSLGDQLIVAGTAGYTRNAIDAAQLDLDQASPGGLFEAVSGGARLERTRFVSRGYRASAKGIRTDNIDASFLKSSAYAADFFGGAAKGYLNPFTSIDYDYAVARLQPVSLQPGDTLTQTGWVNDPSNESYSANNFRVSGQTGALYVQGRFDRRAFGVPVRGNVGLRYEHTQQTIVTLNRSTALSGDIRYDPARFESDYGEWLPSLLVAVDLSDTVVLRLASYKTFVRPQPRNLSPASSVTATDQGFNIVYGGYDLKPFTAVSHDVSLEWYNRSGGMVSLDLYRKNIRNLATIENRLEKLCPADAAAFGLGRLTISGDQCLSDILVNGQRAVITASGAFNQVRPLRVTGLEFSLQQNLDFLPGFWKNFGGVVNYSRTRIDGRNPDGSPAILPGVSAGSYNVIGYYETKRLGVRVVYNYRDEYILSGLNTFTGGTSRVKARGQVDSSIAFAANGWLNLAVDVYNLTNARRTQYQNIEQVPRANDYDGRAVTVSLRGAF
jgi:TonB-dependent receptor